MLDKYFPLCILVFLFTLTVTVFAEKRLIPYLSGKAKQPIYEGGPSWHATKSGTPTMGGIAFVSAMTAAMLFSSLFLLGVGEIESAISLLICAAYAFLNALVGVVDDLSKLKRKENRGLSPKEKLALQTVLAVLFLVCRGIFLNEGTRLTFSFGRVEMGFLYYPLMLVMLLGITNCANLTDGVDGLATSVAFSIGVITFYLSSALYADGAVISSAIIGGTIGFLIFNIHPARIFMGDTGSLFFGSLIISEFFVLKNPLLALLVSGIYVIEGASVILQVICFKTTGRRILKMAPIHHHLEKCGYGENKICIIAMIVTFLLSVPAFIFYLP